MRKLPRSTQQSFLAACEVAVQHCREEAFLLMNGSYCLAYACGDTPLTFGAKTVFTKGAFAACCFIAELW